MVQDAMICTKKKNCLFVTYTIIQSITSSEMCSLHLTNPSTHTRSSGQPALRRPGSSRGFSALLKGHLSRGQFLPEPRFEPRTSGYKSNALSIRTMTALKMKIRACHIVISEITMSAVDGHTAGNAVMVRSCGKRLPLLSGSSIKWEMHPVFSVSKNLSLLAKFTRVADFLKMTCFRGLASLHIHNPLWCTNKWNEDLKEQRVSEYLGLRSCCEFCTGETQFGQNRSVWYFLTLAKVRLCARGSVAQFFLWACI